MAIPQHLIRVGDMFYANVRVPSDIAESYGKENVRRSLRTKDEKRAGNLVHGKVAEIHAEFAEHRAKLAKSAEPKPAPTPQSFADLGRVYGREIAVRQVDALADLYEAAVADPKAFWKGEEVAALREPGKVTGFDRLVEEGDLDRAHHSKRALDRIAALKRMVANGDLAELLELADERSPGLEGKAKRELARTFARSEIAHRSSRASPFNRCDDHLKPSIMELLQTTTAEIEPKLVQFE
jgi:hypothetical protein